MGGILKGLRLGVEGELSNGGGICRGLKTAEGAQGGDGGEEDGMQ